MELNFLVIEENAHILTSNILRGQKRIYFQRWPKGSVLTKGKVIRLTQKLFLILLVRYSTVT